MFEKKLYATLYRILYDSSVVGTQSSYSFFLIGPIFWKISALLIDASCYTDYKASTITLSQMNNLNRVTQQKIIHTRQMFNKMTKPNSFEWIIMKISKIPSNQPTIKQSVSHKYMYSGWYICFLSITKLIHSLPTTRRRPLRTLSEERNFSSRAV